MVFGQMPIAALTGGSMENEEFDAGKWIDRLAEALSVLKSVQEEHREELGERHLQGWPENDSGNPSERYMSLYWNASKYEPRHAEQRCGPFRDALTQVRGILSRHPALAERSESSCNGEIAIRFVNREALWKPSAVIGGLMARGMEAGEDGFKVACSELNMLLDPGVDQDPVDDKLLTGCHVVLFHGVIVDEEIGIGEDLSITPFGQLEEFLDDDMLERLVPGTAKYRAGDQFAAIVKRFPWRPKIGNDGESPEYDWSEIEPFFEDAEVLIELLSLFHAAPVVRLASVPWRFHRRACLLFGEMDFHYGFRADVSSLRPGLNIPMQASRDAIDAAARTFTVRDGERYRHCAPVIARLGEALARQGRFVADDQILDVAIALERMYMPKGRRISAELQNGVAEFLGGDEEERCRTRNEVKRLYDVRSAIIHGPGDDRKKRLLGERADAFRKGYELANRSVVKALSEGLPPDCNAQPEARGNSARERGAAKGTSVPGHRNRHGQTVLGRTETPGNVHD